MSLYTEIRDGVFLLTNRPDLAAETDMAIKQALRTAHRAGSFYRDLVTLELAAQPTGQIQTIDLSAYAPNFRQLAFVKPTGYDLHYNIVDISDLFDDYRCYKTDIVYGVGSSLMIRAAAPVADITICYYGSPTVSPIENITSWIADLHQELIILWAAATIMAVVGEQEVKTRIEALAKLAYQDLIEDNATMIRR